VSETDVAVIGMAGRIPGSDTLEAFWQNLQDGVVSITHFSDDELLRAGVPPETLVDPAYVKAASVLDNVEGFDAAFFGYAPREAALIDPQQRVLLECAWEALETAGYRAGSDPVPVGVYAGSSFNTYAVWTGLIGRLDRDFVLTLSSSDKDFLATRIAYKLNLDGPAITVQCACSTSLAAIHIASQALLNGECDMALAGGVCVKVPQRAGYFWQEGGIVSRDGHVRPFDAAATGTVFGSGAAMVVLKRFADAVADRDSIRAVIVGSAVNNDGAAKTSFSAPSVDKQAQVIVEAQARAAVSPIQVSFVETHGTGTALGDPIELAALAKAWRAGGSQNGAGCAIGSVKANVGHLEAASGVVGLIKTILALEHELVPPLAAWEEPNPACDLSGAPFFVNTQPLPWPRSDAPRRAGVTSLGVGGTNVHLVIEEAPQRPASGPSRPLQVLPLSARTDKALSDASTRLALHLTRNPALPLADIAFTLQTGRAELGRRRAVVTTNGADAIGLLAAGTEPAKGNPARPDARVLFACPSENSIGRLQLDDLFEVPAFRDHYESCMGAGSAAVAPFAVEYGLAHVWMAWGIRPSRVVGEGVGALVACCLSGQLTLAKALAHASSAEPAPASGRIELATQSTDIVVVLGEAPQAPESLAGAAGVCRVDSLPRAGHAMDHMLRGLATLWELGVDVSWSALRAGEVRHRVTLPTYPFQRERFWWDAPGERSPTSVTGSERSPRGTNDSAQIGSSASPISGAPASNASSAP
jgi:acyl transferase domain-containing protein